MQSLKLELKLLNPVLLRSSFHTSPGPLEFRQKVAYKTRYHWMLDLKKSRARAKYPWIPREPPTMVEIDGQQIDFPEMHLDLVVPPDLANFPLKPYVAWRSKYGQEPALTPELLFNKKYAPEISRMVEDGLTKEQIVEQLMTKS